MTKRFLDIVLSALGLLLLAPLFAVLAIAIKLDTAGPVFFRQERVGRFGRNFRIFKFRTMVQARHATGMQLTVAGDARITRVGAVLRRYKLDELPQLIDVLRGTMSLVGPRPEVPRYVEHYPEDSKEKILGLRPGITDFASLQYKDENEILARAMDPEKEYIEVILPEKLRVALAYADSVSLATDLRVLGLTLRTVFVPELPTDKMLKMMNHPRFWRQVDDWMSRPMSKASYIAMLVDSLLVLACWHFTYLFRLGFERWQPGRPWYDDYVSIFVVVVYLIAIHVFGARRALWRFFSFDDLQRLIVACLAAGLVSAVAVLLAQLAGVARAVLVLHPLFSLLALALARMSYRMLWEHAHARATGELSESRYAIVLGAGEVARRLLAGLSRRNGWHVLMLLDDSPALAGVHIAGVKVEGPMDRLKDPDVVARATHVIVALNDASSAERDRALVLAQGSGLVVLTVPSEDELRSASPATA
jgi:lipopolysaccharide/colanic/teichoic acid biosynthesis glycosyltransferase